DRLKQQQYIYDSGAKTTLAVAIPSGPSNTVSTVTNVAIVTTNATPSTLPKTRLQPLKKSDKLKPGDTFEIGGALVIEIKSIQENQSVDFNAIEKNGTKPLSTHTLTKDATETISYQGVNYVIKLAEFETKL